MTGIQLWNIWINMLRKLFKIMELSNEYVQGFNNGYIIRKNHPLLMKNLVKGSKGNSQYLEGLKAGAKQLEKELNVKMQRFESERKSIKKSKDQNIEF